MNFRKPTDYTTVNSTSVRLTISTSEHFMFSGLHSTLFIVSRNAILYFDSSQHNILLCVDQLRDVVYEEKPTTVKNDAASCERKVLGIIEK